jgi:hypothetical protein
MRITENRDLLFNGTRQHWCDDVQIEDLYDAKSFQPILEPVFLSK